MKSRRVGPPDGGYGWVVVASAFVVMGLTGAVLKNFGHFFLDIQSHFGVMTSTTSWVSSTTIAMFHIGAPAASALTLQFSQRAVIIAGGFLCTLGMLLASLDLSLPGSTSLWVSWKKVTDWSDWFSAPCLVLIVVWYRHFLLMDSCHQHGESLLFKMAPHCLCRCQLRECVFAIVFSPLFKWLIEMYSWRALCSSSEAFSSTCVCAALMRPLEATRSASQTNGKEGAEEHAAALPSKKKAVFQCCLLKKPELLLYILFAIFSAAGFFLPTLFLVPFANSLGIDKYWPAFILSAMAVADLAGRLSCGWLANMRFLRNLQLLTTVTTLLGVVLLLLPISHNYWSVLVFASLYGFLFGCMVAIHVTSIVDIVSLEGFDSGLGLFMVFRSIGGFIGPPAAGWLVDQMHDYRAAFYLSGFCLITSAVFVVLVDRLVQRRKSAEASGHQTIN